MDEICHADQEPDSASPARVAGGRSRSWNGCSCEVYSGRVRQQLLDAAIARGDAVSVVAFFNGFLREAAGQHGQGPAWPRQATTGKPVYSRAQILERAVLRRKGAIILLVKRTGPPGGMRLLLPAARGASPALCPWMQITADPVGSPRHQRPLGTRKAQRKQEGGKGEESPTAGDSGGAGSLNSSMKTTPLS